MSKRTYSSTRSNAARKIVAAQGSGPCTICHRVVLVDQHRWQADHITPRAVAEMQGWSAAEIDNPSNLGISHASCNEASGAKLGNQLKAQAKAQPRKVTPIKRPQLEFLEEDTRTPAAAPQILSPQEAPDGL